MFEKIEKRLLKNKISFRKYGEAYIFYPWSFPSEGFKISKTAASYVYVSQILLIVFLLIHSFGTIFLRRYGLIEFATYATSYIVFVTFWPTVYFLAVTFLAKGSEVISLPPKERRLGWRVYCYFIWIFFQIDAFLELYDYTYNFVFIFCGLSFIYSSIVFFKILITRGHIFSKG